MREPIHSRPNLALDRNAEAEQSERHRTLSVGLRALASPTTAFRSFGVGSGLSWCGANDVCKRTFKDLASGSLA